MGTAVGVELCELGIGRMVPPWFENVAQSQELRHHFRIKVSVLPSRIHPTCLSIC